MFKIGLSLNSLDILLAMNLKTSPFIYSTRILFI